MLAFPFLLLAIVIAFLLSGSIGRGILTAAIAITVAYIPLYFRVIRNHVISIREESYVEAARAIGARPFTVIRKYVFFNVIQNVPPLATLNAADAILTLAALGFLGYGIQPTEAAEWGYDIQRAVSDSASGIWWTALFPGLAIVLLVTGLTLLGEGLNETINPVLRKRPTMAVELPTTVEARRDSVTDQPVVSVRDLRVYYGTIRGPYVPSTVCRSTSLRASWSGSSANRDAASRRSGAASSVCFPRGRCRAASWPTTG